MEIRRIGDWITSLYDDRCPAPQELVGAYEPSVRRRVADYLDAGVVADDDCDLVTKCRFDCQHTQPVNDLCDGVWCWPSDLDHYVRVHSVRLPNDFIEHALSNSMPRDLPALDPGELGDDDYWLDWCTKVRDAGFVAALRDAKAEADRLYAIEQAEYLEQAIREFEANHRLSTARCQWRDCDRRALHERAFCALHMGSVPRDSPKRFEIYSVAPLLKSYFGAGG